MAKLNATYVKSIRGTDPILSDGTPQITFVGRSNVGKSSLINSVLGQTLARSSSSPGKTVNMDFFGVGDRMYFVDLPGYGYAKATPDERERFGKMIFWYLTKSEAPIRLVVLIIDAQVGLTAFDRETVSILTHQGTAFVIAANKIDKLKQSERSRAIASLTADAGTVPVIPYSAKTGEGRQTLWHLITARIQSGTAE